MVSLIHDAQEIAILNGKEILNLESLNEAYQQRLSTEGVDIVELLKNHLPVVEVAV